MESVWETLSNGHKPDELRINLFKVLCSIPQTVPRAVSVAIKVTLLQLTRKKQLSLFMHTFLDRTRQLRHTFP